MLNLAAAAGLEEHQLLADDKPAPNPDLTDEFFAVCTDDVMHWARSVSVSADRLARLDVQWSRAGISRRPNKDLD